MPIAAALLAEMLADGARKYRVEGGLPEGCELVRLHVDPSRPYVAVATFEGPGLPEVEEGSSVPERVPLFVDEL